MQRYIVRVTETLSRSWVVEAENENAAGAKIETAYNNGDVILDYDDYSEFDIEVTREATENDTTYYDIWEDKK